MELYLFAFFSGILTIFAPCIWPILPIVLGASLGGYRRSVGVVLGLVGTFAVLTLSLSYVVRLIPLDANVLRYFSLAILLILGFSLLIPQVGALLEAGLSRFTSRFQMTGTQQNKGFLGGFLFGATLGIVWSPCAGPILATIATLSATRTLNIQGILLTVVFAVGLALPLLAFAFFGNRVVSRAKGLNKYTGVAQRVFGAIIIIFAILTYFNAATTIQVKILEAIPAYDKFLMQFERSDAVTSALNTIQDTTGVTQKQLSNSSSLPYLGQPPEFVGITRWLNSEPLKMSELKGKVVLVDFWTYTCINCIRTLPYITKWYDTYKDDGLVVVGVHSPEFEFEKSTANVEGAIKQFKINYPVAQDNDFTTWRAYGGNSWPRHYLIDVDGNIREYHVGEGNYEETEANIRALLKEAGKEATKSAEIQVNEAGYRPGQTPETYLGTARMERLSETETDLPLHHVYFSKGWDAADEYSESTPNSSLKMRIQAKDVYLVMKPATEGKTGTAVVIIDGKKVKTITVDRDMIYDIASFDEYGEHEIELRFPTEPIQVFAFTFGS